MSGWYQLGVVKFKSKKPSKKIQTHTFNKTHLVVVVKKLLTKLEEEEVSRKAVNSSSSRKRVRK